MIEGCLTSEPMEVTYVAYPSCLGFGFEGRRVRTNWS